MRYKVRLQRHTKTGQHQIDTFRELTPEGEDQARRAALMLGDEPISVGLVSPTARTRRVAEIMFEDHTPSIIREIPQIYPDPENSANEAIWAMFKMVGNKPLTTYRSHPSFELLEAIGTETAARIEEIASEIGDGASIVLIGHGVLNPAVARAIAKTIGDENAVREIEDMNPGEGDAIVLDVNDDKVDVSMIVLTGS